MFIKSCSKIIIIKSGCILLIILYTVIHEYFLLQIILMINFRVGIIFGQAAPYCIIVNSAHKFCVLSFQKAMLSGNI